MNTTPILNADKLNEAVSKLNDKYVNQGKLPHLLVAVTDATNTTFKYTSGYADIASKQPLSFEHHTRIYSMTKPLTCMALMICIERGMAKLDDPVSKYLPQLAHLMVAVDASADPLEMRPAKTTLTLEHILTHRSGMTYGFNQLTQVDQYCHANHLDYVGQFDRDAWLNALAKAPLRFDPGSAWNYGVSTDVVGFVVEALTGKRLGAVLQEWLFEPLAMHNTSFHYRGSPNALTSCYQRTDDELLKLQDPHADSSFSQAPKSDSGGGGLISTAPDYLKFMRLLLNKGRCGHHQIIGAETLHQMHQNQLPNNKAIADISVGGFTEARNLGVGYGFGFNHRFDIEASGVPGNIGEYGWGGMASTNFWIDPVLNTGVLLMTQLIPSSTYDIRSELRRAYYASLT